MSRMVLPPREQLLSRGPQEAGIELHLAARTDQCLKVVVRQAHLDKNESCDGSNCFRKVRDRT
jgi:hypothetical protein